MALCIDIVINEMDRRLFMSLAGRNTEEMGIGLSIAKTLIERMHGSITAAYEKEELMIRIML